MYIVLIDDRMRCYYHYGFRFNLRYFPCNIMMSINCIHYFIFLPLPLQVQLMAGGVQYKLVSIDIISSFHFYPFHLMLVYFNLLAISSIFKSVVYS